MRPATQDTLQKWATLEPIKISEFEALLKEGGMFTEIWQVFALLSASRMQRGNSPIIRTFTKVVSASHAYTLVALERETYSNPDNQHLIAKHSAAIFSKEHAAYIKEYLTTLATLEKIDQSF